MGKEPLREQGGGEASTCARVGHRARVRRAVISGGASEFGEAKLLEALLFYCVPRVDTAPLAKLLLARFGTLRGVLNAGREELEAVNGVKEYASAFFLLLRELLQREGGAFGAANFLDPDSVRRYLVSAFRNAEREAVYAFYIAQNGSLLGRDLTFRGDSYGGCYPHGRAFRYTCAQPPEREPVPERGRYNHHAQYRRASCRKRYRADRALHCRQERLCRHNES